ncbi:MAG TPA: alanine--tRNA ligase [Fimbriiglobus sp.]|nr:alanine--tRNA ligase [Fimbriiglobus sp.]
MPSSNEIRQQFIDFFCRKHGHTFVPSSPVVPHDDPTLLFANAGMNQFKPYFLGTEKPPFKRAANTQKCIRAGGKHNDLDDVGKDTYHHTFFEMLGNWSFGDYFKKEAIAWAWELLTGVWKIDPARLHVTVFEGDPANGIPRDDEAANHWRAVGVPDAQIHLGNKKDNFWEMGSMGPCGPCTEVHYDSTPDKSGGPLVNQGTDKVIEIWNLVFIQFNRNEDQSLTPLPAKHVDTGMGFERITKVLQGKESNYDTDVFTPILDTIGQLTGLKYGGRLDDMTDVGFRVIADHLRMATFAIVDGARPGNKKRDAVLRSVIRRAVRFGYMFFDRREPFLCALVPVLVEQMGGAFPELRQRGPLTAEVLRSEEKDFFRTITKGLALFEAAAATAEKKGRVIDGDSAADLQTTHGFPFDLTRQMAEERGLSADKAGYDEAIRRHKTRSREGRETVIVSAIRGELPKTNDAPKYQPTPVEATVLGWVKDNAVVREGALAAGESTALLTDRTNFYAEQGGQVGDAGTATGKDVEFEIEDTKRLGDTVLHVGSVQEGTLSVGQKVRLEVSSDRPATMKNHTATHLLNLALRQVLGGQVDQKGSLVDADKTRFDFTHDKPLTKEQLREVEERVNQIVERDLPVTPVPMPLAEARKLPGVRAVFGEKYPDPVRVVMIGADKPEAITPDLSVEFCGGTHLSRTGPIGYFKIVSQEGVAKGVRRVTAVTGRVALEEIRKMSAVVDDLTGKFQCRAEELPARVESLQEEVKKLQQQLKKGVAADLTGVVDKLLADAPEINGVKLVVGQLPAASVEQVRAQIDRIRQKAQSALVVSGWIDDAGKVPIVVALTNDLVARGLKAPDIIKPVAEIVGGKGGGKPDLAQAGGKDANKLREALAKAEEIGQELLKK